MTREELKEHCEKQIENCEMWAISKNEKPSGKIYEEHKLILELLELEPCEDCISRADALMCLTGEFENREYEPSELIKIFSRRIKALPPVTPQEPRWIPVSERLPKDLEPVNITWVNRNPESYYANIKDKPFTATGVYFNGQWYWWSTLCTDMLAEYSHNYDDIIDDDIEITAWQPLPQSFEPQKSEG